MGEERGDTIPSSESSGGEHGSVIPPRGAGVPTCGYMPDHEILAHLHQGELIEEGTWEASSVRHASYALRFGTRAEHRTRDDGHRRLQELTPEGSPVRIEPGQTTLLYSVEHLRLPDDVLAFTVARGLLFVEGLAPENTYVDPGFRGPLYTTITNVSDRAVEIPVGMTVARLFFYRLPSACAKPYRPAVALGIEQQLPTIPVLASSSVTGMTEHSRADLEGVLTAGGPAGRSAAELSRRQREHIQRVYILAIVWPILLTVATTNFARENLWAFGGSVVASIVAAILFAFAPKAMKAAQK